MDEIDVQILKLLERTGRLSHEEIGKLVHISRPAVHQRVAKLEKNGVIKGYRAIIDWRMLEQKIQAFIFVKVKCQSFQQITAKILNIPLANGAILECQRLAGEWCMVLKVRVSSPDDITRFLDELVTFSEVYETSTTFILSTLHENGFSEL